MKVLVIENDPEILEFITIAFKAGWAGAELISTGRGSEGVRLIETESPELTILDLDIPGENGFETIKQIRYFSAVPLVLITKKDSEADIVKGLELGADEYVNKPFGQLELLARIRAIFRRKHSPRAYIPIIYGTLQLDPSSSVLMCGSQKISLTRTEGFIMGHLMTNAHRLVTYSELAEVIWGGIYPKASDTIRVYIRRLRAKINATPLSVSISCKPGRGYFLTKPVSKSV
jgi:two-component system KDP operon response regulator KdpE